MLVPYAGHHNQVFRTGQRAKIAGDAKSFISLGINVEPGRPPIAFRYFGPFGWVVFGVDVFGALMAKCNPQALEQVDQTVLKNFLITFPLSLTISLLRGPP